MEQRRRPEDPFTDTIESAVKVGVACGAVGFLFGGAVGIVKGLPPFFAAAATSLQTFGLGSTFTFARLGIIEAWTTENHAPTPNELISATALAGGISGSSVGLIFRGRRNVLPGALMWSIFGAAGQYGYNKFTASKEPTPSRPGFWQRMSEKSWTPFKILTNEEYAAMLKERQLKLDVEISILDDKIAAMREQEEKEKVGPGVQGTTTK